MDNCYRSATLPISLSPTPSSHIVSVHDGDEMRQFFG